MPTHNADDFNNPLAISQGGTNASSMASTNGVTYYDGTRLVTTTAGVAMQLLTSNGSGNAPTWQAGGGGAPSGHGWDLIQSQTTAGSVLTFTTGITNSYNTYVIVYSAGSTTELDIRYSTNGGVSYATSGYQCQASRVALISSTPPGSAGPSTSLLWGIVNSGGGSATAYGSVIYLFNVTSGISTSILGFGSANRIWNMCNGTFGNSSAINALQFSSGGGSIPGTISLYGVNE